MKILVSALEASSNEHLRNLLQEFSYREIELFGIFDSTLGSPLYTPRDFSVMGFVDILKKISFFVKVQKQMLELAKDVDKILLLDSSSFHIPLAKKIKQKYPEKQIIYYILPQVWAWKPWRAKVIEKFCDRLGAILPFEIEFYKKKAKYVGHPLLDTIKNFKETLGGEGIAFMPGSRLSEIRMNFPVFSQLAKTYFNDKKKILIVPKIYMHMDLVELYGDAIREFEISYDAKTSLLNAEFAFICSGTATLESALIGTPFVLAYKTKWIDYFIYKSLIRIRYIGLANIFFNAICNEKAGFGKNRMHFELIQKNFNAEQLFFAYQNTNRNDFFTKSKQIREYLKFGSAKTIAQWIRD